MSAAEHGTYESIVRSVYEARGAAAIAKMAAPDPHERDLPVRHHMTGQIVAYVQEDLAAGMVPVVLNGLVVGYYKDTDAGRLRPMFDGGKVSRFVYCKPGEEWANRFGANGEQTGAFLVRKTPAQ